MLSSRCTPKQASISLLNTICNVTTPQSLPAKIPVPYERLPGSIFARKGGLGVACRTRHGREIHAEYSCTPGQSAVPSSPHQVQGYDGESQTQTLSAKIGRKWTWYNLLAPVMVCSIAILLFGGQALAAEASGGLGVGRAFKGVVSFILHLDVHLSQIIAKHGNATYWILFAIVFCETGLVITPFLPGDSLLFAAGAFASLGHLNISALLATFISSAILGDALNYQLGKWFGAKATNSRLVKKEYIDKTEAFYKKHGGKTVVLARFIPIVRTFAPFVAGVGTMPYGKFAAYNVGGAVLWSVLFVGAGALLGNLPAVKHNFSIVVFAIVGISLLPLLFEVVAAKREGRLSAAQDEASSQAERLGVEGHNA